MEEQANFRQATIRGRRAKLIEGTNRRKAS